MCTCCWLNSRFPSYLYYATFARGVKRIVLELCPVSFLRPTNPAYREQGAKQSAKFKFFLWALRLYRTTLLQTLSLILRGIRIVRGFPFFIPRLCVTALLRAGKETIIVRVQL